MIITQTQIAAKLLMEGKLVAIPTETVYGLAANGFDGKAIARIYEVKNRPQFNPLILHSNSFNRFEEWGIKLPLAASKLSQKFSPGPITFVVPKSDIIPDITTAGQNSVAIRVPNHELCLELLSMLPFPLAAPSANLSGTVSPTQAAHVEAQLGNLIAAVLDGGTCNIGLESTIISFTQAKPRLLRLGGLAIEEIEEALQMKLDTTALQNNENPEAPGMLSRHYAPKTKLFMGEISDLLKEEEPNDIAFIRFKQLLSNYPKENQIILSSTGSLTEAAQNLFAAIRKADDLQKKYIVAEVLPEENLGRAINDRLRRAAVH